MYYVCKKNFLVENCYIIEDEHKLIRVSKDTIWYNKFSEDGYYFLVNSKNHREMIMVSMKIFFDYFKEEKDINSLG